MNGRRVAARIALNGMSDLIKISQGTVYDPANGIDGEVRDLWIAGGKIVAAPTDPAVRPTREIDARGLVVMPGGVDMHCHIAGPKVNVARKMRPEEKRKAEVLHRTANTHSGTMGSVPSTFATGYKYAGMGYTTAFDAAIPPLGARHAHEEFEDTPCIDKGFYVLMGNNHYVMRVDPAERAAKAQGVHRLAAWRDQGLCAQARESGRRGSLEEPSGRQRPQPRRARRSLRRHAAADHRRRGASGRRTAAAAPGAHPLQQPRHARQLANHAGNDEGPGRPPRRTSRTSSSTATAAAKATRTRSTARPCRWPSMSTRTTNMTIDVGQVMFGETTSMTGDGPLGYYLSNIFKGKWFSATPRWKPAAASRRSSTATSRWSTRCNGRSGWSGTCWSTTRGAW